MRNLLRESAENQRETTRIEAFSDGVIAIAITLLVLELRVSASEDASREELWQALGDLWPSYLGYVISFFTIGIMWANHHTIFRYIARTDHYLILTNLLFLFFIATMPFPTSLMAEFLGHPAEQVGIIVYSGWFLATALSYNLLWRWASTGNRLIDPGADPAAVKTISSRFNLGPPAYGLAFVLAFFSTEASLALLLGLALIYILPYGSVSR